MPRHGASRQERGYDARHDRIRASYQRRMDRGRTYHCPRCGGAVDPTDWHLDHTDDRKSWLGPSHPKCNSKAGAANRPSRIRPQEKHPGLR